MNLQRGTKVLVVAYVEKIEADGKITIEVGGHKVHGELKTTPQAAADTGDGGSETTPIVDLQETTPIVD